MRCNASQGIYDLNITNILVEILRSYEGINAAVYNNQLFRNEDVRVLLYLMHKFEIFTHPVNNDLDKMFAELLSGNIRSLRHLRNLICILATHRALTYDRIDIVYQNKQDLHFIANVLYAAHLHNLLNRSNIDAVLDSIISNVLILQEIIPLFSSVFSSYNNISEDSWHVMFDVTAHNKLGLLLEILDRMENFDRLSDTLPNFVTDYLKNDPENDGLAPCHFLESYFEAVTDFKVFDLDEAEQKILFARKECAWKLFEMGLSPADFLVILNSSYVAILDYFALENDNAWQGINKCLIHFLCKQYSEEIHKEKPNVFSLHLLSENVLKRMIDVIFTLTMKERSHPVREVIQKMYTFLQPYFSTKDATSELIHKALDQFLKNTTIIEDTWSSSRASSPTLFIPQTLSHNTVSMSSLLSPVSP